MLKVLLFVFFIAPGSHLFCDKIKIGFFLLEPFMMEGVRDQNPCGVTIEFYEKYLAPKMGIEIEWIGSYTFSRLTMMLENGEMDAICQLTKTEEREEKFIFSHTPLTKIITCILVTKDSPIKKIARPEDLYEKRIGYFETGYIPDFLKKERIFLDLTTSIDYRKINLEKLLGKRIDAMFDLNYVSMVYYNKIYGYSDKVRILFLPIDPVNVYCMFTDSEKGKRLKESFDRANAELIGKKVFDSLTKKYL